MSAGAGISGFGEDRRPLTHVERLEIFTRMSAIERLGDATRIALDERGKATDRRLSSLERGLERLSEQSAIALDKLGQQSKDDHDAMGERLDALEKAIAAGRLSAKDILLATSPLSVAIVALIGVLLTSGAPT
jgi:hypothetical protein